MRRRNKAILIGVVVLAAAVGAWAVFLPPGSDRTRAVAAACDDADGLFAAGLLDEAQTAYRAIARHVSQDEARTARRPACRDGESQVVASESAAARAREQGDQYFAGVSLTRRTKGAPATARFESSRMTALQRARSGYVQALEADPFAADVHASLRSALGLFGVPPDAGANGRCSLAMKLVGARLYPEAAVVYGQALRTGRTTRCVAGQLRVAREERADAMRRYAEARRLQAAGDKKAARAGYVGALAVDPSLAAARTALAATHAPDPRDGTPTGRAKDVVDFVAPAWTWTGGAVRWPGDHLKQLLAALALGLALILLARAALVLITRWKPGRDLVALVHTPRFTVMQRGVAPFAPEEVAGTTSTLVAHWMSEPLVRPDAGMESAVASPSPLDCWTAPATVGDGLSTLLTEFNPAAGALVAFARSVSPSRRVSFTGYVLERCEHGPGLRIVQRTRWGKLSAARLWWARDLPGTPLTGEDEEAEARHALAVHAATWAQYRTP